METKLIMMAALLNALLRKGTIVIILKYHQDVIKKHCKLLQRHKTTQKTALNKFKLIL